MSAATTDPLGVTLAALGIVLSVPVGPDDSFFALGGDSIAAVELAGRLAEHGWFLEVDDVFAADTFRDLALRVRPAVATRTQA